MNAAVITNESVKPRLAGRNKVREFGMLLKREIWEHKGAIIWTPLVLAALQVIVSLIAGGAGLYRLNQVGIGQVVIDGREVALSGDTLQQAMSKLTAGDLIEGGHAADIFYYASSMWPLLVAGIVAFFYCLGALYDERRDRSILFWKSMPVSDTQTVLSKLAVALVVIPLVAMLVSTALVLIYSFILWAFLAWQGGNGSLMWANTHPFQVIGSIYASLPVHALWAAPAAAWLLLCSAFAKRLPILWAVGIPLVLGLVLLWIEAGMSWGQDTSMVENYFRHVVARILPGIVPGSFVSALPNIDVDFERNLMPYSAAVLQAIYGVFLKLETWIGIAAAALMLWIAIQLRRRNGAI